MKLLLKNLVFSVVLLRYFVLNLIRDSVCYAQCKAQLNLFSATLALNKIVPFTTIF